MYWDILKQSYVFTCFQATKICSQKRFLVETCIWYMGHISPSVNNTQWNFGSQDI
jgi:hypothetical protein